MRPCFWEVTSSMSTERPQWGRASPHGSMTGGSPALGPPVQAVGAGEGVPGLQLTHPPAVAPPTARGCRGWGPYWRWGLRALSIARRSCPGAPPGQPLAHEQPSRPGFLLGPGSHKHVTVAKHVASDMSPHLQPDKPLAAPGGWSPVPGMRVCLPASRRPRVTSCQCKAQPGLPGGSHPGQAPGGSRPRGRLPGTSEWKVSAWMGGMSLPWKAGSLFTTSSCLGPQPLTQASSGHLCRHLKSLLLWPQHLGSR